MAKRKSKNGADEMESDDSPSESSESIESAMQELASIVAVLESGQGTLDESLRQFERGTSLLRLCHKQLDAAAQRIEIVTRMADSGEIETSVFDSTATLHKQDRTRTPRAAANADDENDESETGRSLF